jgi:hypothetical protein
MRWMISLLVLLIATGSPLSGLYGQELFKVTSGPGCNDGYYAWMSAPAGSGFLIWIEVPRWRELANETFRKEVFEAAFQHNLQHCKAQGRGASVAVVTIGLQRHGSILAAWTAAKIALGALQWTRWRPL